MGTFGMIYILINLMPSISYKYSNIICLFSVISIVYGAFVALAQKNIITMIGFSSISHFGFIILGIFSFNDLGFKGAKIYMLAHGITICALFLFASFIKNRQGSFSFNELGGLQRKYPYLSAMFLISCLSLIAVPGTISFPGEFMIIIGAFQIHKLWAIFALFGAILGAVYTLLAYQKIFTGPLISGKTIKIPIKQKYTFAEKFISLTLITFIVLFGFLPMLLI
jgi:NADH-quinone oxidoreductase subunit M